MKPNFYFIFTPDLLQDIPSSWLVSFRIEQQHDGLLTELSRNHPTVSLMDIRAMGAKIQDLLTQIVWSITVLALMGVVAGILLIFTLLRLSLSQALVAGIVAALSADVVVASVMKFGFDLSPSLHLNMWLVLPIVTFCTLAAVVNSLIKRLLVPINKAFN